MVRLDYSGRSPLDKPKPMIQNWTPYNRQIASRRRCYHILGQLPNKAIKQDFCIKVNTAIPQEIDNIELELKASVLNGDFGKLLTNHSFTVPAHFGI